MVKDILGIDTVPDVNAMLFLIGMQELGRIKPNFSKEEKQDLMHLAVCRLLSSDGYYEFVGRDTEDWPHYKLVAAVPKQGEGEQEVLLKAKIITYFQEWEAQSTDDWQGEI